MKLEKRSAQASARQVVTGPNREAIRWALAMLAEESRLVGSPDAADLIEQAMEKLRARMN
ncbi:hypothetical protein [Zavarzinia sp. CC-PAN008]|uniref:hypothetical protein n=1 Tax=Zavarzinia sp. CC-PAN008 TaxID=3243332 RepID=UPI003F748C06